MPPADADEVGAHRDRHDRRLHMEREFRAERIERRRIELAMARPLRKDQGGTPRADAFSPFLHHLAQILDRILAQDPDRRDRPDHRAEEGIVGQRLLEDDDQPGPGHQNRRQQIRFKGADVVRDPDDLLAQIGDPAKALDLDIAADAFDEMDHTYAELGPFLVHEAGAARLDVAAHEDLGHERVEDRRGEERGKVMAPDAPGRGVMTSFLELSLERFGVHRPSAQFTATRCRPTRWNACCHPSTR